MRKLLFILPFLFSTYAFGSYSEVNFGADIVAGGCPYHSVSKISSLCLQFVKDKSRNFTHSLIESGCPESIVSNLSDSCLLVHDSTDQSEKIITTVAVGCAVVLGITASGLELNYMRGLRRLGLEIDFLKVDDRYIQSLSNQIRNGSFQYHGQITIGEIHSRRRVNYQEVISDRTMWQNELFEQFMNLDESRRIDIHLCSAINAPANIMNRQDYVETELNQAQYIISSLTELKSNEREGTHGRYWFSNGPWVRGVLNSLVIATPIGSTLYALWHQ